jgi:hypothetical protein
VYEIVLLPLGGIEKVPVVLKVIQLANELGCTHAYREGLHNGVPFIAPAVQSSTLNLNE